MVERAFAGSAELDGVDVGRRRLGAEGVEALPGGLGTVEGAGVGDATRGDVAVVRHLAAAGDGEVVQEVPLVAEGGEGGELGVVVEAEVAEEGADDGAVLLLDAVVVVFAVGAGAGEPDVGVVGSEEGEEVVVEEFAPSSVTFVFQITPNFPPSPSCVTSGASSTTTPFPAPANSPKSVAPTSKASPVAASLTRPGLPGNALTLFSLNRHHHTSTPSFYADVARKTLRRLFLTQHP